MRGASKKIIKLPSQSQSVASTPPRHRRIAANEQKIIAAGDQKAKKYNRDMFLSCMKTTSEPQLIRNTRKKNNNQRKSTKIHVNLRLRLCYIRHHMNTKCKILAANRQ